MKYVSTRNKNISVCPSEAVVNGIADDGGLYMFSDLDGIKIDYKELIGKSTFEIASKVIGTLIDDFSPEEMDELVSRAYTGKFETEDLTPIVKVGDKYVLELFRGPTSAFKDVALSMLPQLLCASAKKNGITDKIVILTATSGDTGKAALAGFMNVEGTEIIVFYPESGVSEVQKAQMVTQEGNNVCVCAVKGNFDDAQTGVKNIFTKVGSEKIFEGKGVRLSSANSINIGRLAPQVVYYFKAYSDLVSKGDISVGDEVNFCVPTGNFGNILAGYLAKKMGLPVGKLICASNENNVLTDFFKTGEYNRCRPFKKTVSPSMDILISSNLERLLYLESGCDNQYVSSLMKDLSISGRYEITGVMKESLDAQFFAEYCDDKSTESTISEVYSKYGYLCDTHTAVAWNVAEKYCAKTADTRPTVVLSTASPFKFPASVASAIGMDGLDNEFELMENLSKFSGVEIPKGLCDLGSRQVKHTDVCNKNEMMKFVMSKVSSNE